MAKTKIVHTQAWREIRQWLHEQLEECLCAIVKETQTYNDTQAIRGRIKAHRELIEWVQNDNRGDEDDDEEDELDE